MRLLQSLPLPRPCLNLRQCCLRHREVALEEVEGVGRRLPKTGASVVVGEVGPRWRMEAWEAGVEVERQRTSLGAWEAVEEDHRLVKVAVALTSSSSEVMVAEEARHLCSASAVEVGAACPLVPGSRH